MHHTLFLYCRIEIYPHNEQRWVFLSYRCPTFHLHHTTHNFRGTKSIIMFALAPYLQPSSWYSSGDSKSQRQPEERKGKRSQICLWTYLMKVIPVNNRICSVRVQWRIPHEGSDSKCEPHEPSGKWSSPRMDFREQTGRVIPPTLTDTLVSQAKTSQAIPHEDAFKIDAAQRQIQWQANAESRLMALRISPDDVERSLQVVTDGTLEDWPAFQEQTGSA